MTESITDLLKTQDEINYATNIGQNVHKKMQHVFVDNDIWHGDKNITDKISQHAELTRFFTKNALTEIPVAGIINNHFISRRIDRMIINHTTHNIDILDYKTNTIRDDIIRKKYQKQVNEYIEIMQKIYPNYTINGYILWLHDCFLDKLN